MLWDSNKPSRNTQALDDLHGRSYVDSPGNNEGRIEIGNDKVRIKAGGDGVLGWALVGGAKCEGG